ncbi:hypothetical protein GDO86_019018 [Hymenochirus boettgeri]|uniref:Folate receptor-like domain-containing protein n=1 Tax=Hymenochirus boettgeri TaxID=247094 RepID=A0A8T2IJN7_9PIPI|nr:hypothetical protein GDO86_019018 [Hymenochirus boettgeri]KAG8431345.1 hypothetical protein GDO86_019018 [Hymenochirus boettgeri]
MVPRAPSDCLSLSITMLRGVLLLGLVLCANSVNYMDICLNGKHQKVVPGPEDVLHGQCTPWKEKSCCTNNTSAEAHKDQSLLYNFNWNHCGTMSDTCKKHFIQDTCFYECSPNLGPWIQKVDSSWRRERILDVPLCQEECDTWYRDCRLQYTCMDNWHTGWNWTSGTNQCPTDKPCRLLADVFPTAKDFCEKVWSNSYKYTTMKRGSGQCMQIWFDVGNGNVNPNVAVTKYYADKLNSAGDTRVGLLLVLAPLVLLWAI